MAPVRPPAEAPIAVRETERRVITALFCDLARPGIRTGPSEGTASLDEARALWQPLRATPRLAEVDSLLASVS